MRRERGRNVRKKRKVGRWILGSLGIVIVLIVAPRVIGLRRGPSTTAATPAYFVETSLSGSFTGQVAASGSMAPRALATVESPVAGTVSSFSVSQGSAVSAGDVLATFASGVRITSPITGRVVSLSASSGDYVSPGETLANVADMSSMFADLTVPETVIAQVARGQSVSLSLPALPDRTFKGTVTEVGRQGATGTSGGVVFPVTVKVDAPSGILIGMTVNATITTARIGSSVYVPTSAIETVNGRTAVLVPQSLLNLPYGAGNGGGQGPGRSNISGRGRFLRGLFGGSGAGALSATTIPKTVYVTVGATNASYTQIVSGLAGGREILVPNPAASQAATTGSGGGRGAFRFGGGGNGGS